jgi:hypothetical protein
MLAPTMALAGNAPKGASLGIATRKDLARRMGGPRSARLTATAANVFGTRVVQAVQTRDIPLEGLDRRLKGVVAVAHEPVLIGGSGGRASVFGAMPHRVDTEVEVESFVKSLLSHDRIDLGKGKKKAMVASDDREAHATHAIKSVAGKKVLQRIRFRCGCCL